VFIFEKINQPGAAGLCWVWSAAEYMRKTIASTHPALEILRSPLAGTFYSMGFEYQRTLEEGRKILERETRGIEPHPYAVEDANWRSVLPRLREKQEILRQ
jgi:hypothetical protein